MGKYKICYLHFGYGRIFLVRIARRIRNVKSNLSTRFPDVFEVNNSVIIVVTVVIVVDINYDIFFLRCVTFNVVRVLKMYEYCTKDIIYET